MTIWTFFFFYKSAKFILLALFTLWKSKYLFELLTYIFTFLLLVTRMYHILIYKFIKNSFKNDSMKLNNWGKLQWKVTYISDMCVWL